MQPVGELLREWRERKRLTQLDLALQAEISTRHLSFVETGRSAPSREMILLLAAQMELSHREQNRLLLAAGYAPVYSENPLDSPQLDSVLAAVRRVLAANEPYPALAVDRQWNLIEANAGVNLLTEGVAPELLGPPTNVLRVSLHPKGMAPNIINLREWRALILANLRRQIAGGGDADLAALYQELVAFSYVDGADQPEPKEYDGVFVPLRLRHPLGELSFLSTITTFGTPLDITIAELAIESFFPADRQTATILREFGS